MVVLNNNDTESRTIDCKRFVEILKDYSRGTDVISGNTYKLDKIKINKKSALILELKK